MSVSGDDVDHDVVATLLTSRSRAEAVLAFSVLRETLPEDSLLFLINLRELIEELPEPPFWVAGDLALLHDVLGYEDTGRSYRMRFESDHGVFGLEFVGANTTCEAVAVHTLGQRFLLHGDSDDFLDQRFITLLLHHPDLLDRLLEAMELLGVPLSPEFYLSPEDFLAEHAASAAAEFDVL